jgi:hypothetical protein
MSKSEPIISMLEFKKLVHHDLSRWGKWEYFVHVIKDGKEDEEPTFRFKIYTSEHSYCIVAIESKRTYLGCIATTRKPRAGEEHYRGNDLPDGKLTRKTWDAIKTAIIGYELEKIIVPGPVEPKCDIPKILNCPEDGEDCINTKCHIAKQCVRMVVEDIKSDASICPDNDGSDCSHIECKHIEDCPYKIEPV